MAGRPIYQIVTRDWFRTRVIETIADMKTEMETRGEKLTVDLAGQALILKEISALFERAVQAGHFEEGQWYVNPVTITDADRLAQRLRFTGAAQFANSVRIVQFTFDFTTAEVVAQVAA